MSTTNTTERVGRYQAILDFEVEIGEITEEGARSRRAGREARMRDLDRSILDRWEALQPMPGPELIRAERRLLEAMMAEPRFRDRWFRERNQAPLHQRLGTG